MRTWHHLYPALPAFSAAEQLRAGLGATVGIGLCAAMVQIGVKLGVSSLYLIAPLGATAVLVFCVPNSPLAQPWSAIVGNTSAALIAWLAVHLLPGDWMVGVAVGASIITMMMLRALHPPGGAVALLTALDPAPAVQFGPLFALTPVGLMTAALVLIGVAYNRITGRMYPFRQPVSDGSRKATPRLGLSNEQLGQLLDRFNQATNLGIVDLGRLLAAAEAEAAQHRFDGTTCADIMTRNLITVRPDTTLTEAARLFKSHAIKSLPVVDQRMKLHGLVLQSDLLNSLVPQAIKPAWRQRSSRKKVMHVMRGADRAVPYDMPVGAMLNRLAVNGSEVIPVIRDGHLVGILTRSDIIRLLLSGAEERAAT